MYNLNTQIIKQYHYSINSSCVESDFEKNQPLCPMYMTFLKKNIESSPCTKQLRMMTKLCRRMPSKRPDNLKINTICKGATNELRRCVQGTKDIYDYMSFWTTYDGQTAPNLR